MSLSGIWARAIPHYREVLETRLISGANHEKIQLARINLMYALYKHDDLGKARQTFMSYLAGHEWLGPDHQLLRAAAAGDAEALDQVDALMVVAISSEKGMVLDDPLVIQGGGLAAAVRQRGWDPGRANSCVRFALESGRVSGVLDRLVGAIRLHGRTNVATLVLEDPPSEVVRAFAELVASGYDPWQVRTWWAREPAALAAAISSVEERDSTDLGLILDLNEELGASAIGDALRTLMREVVGQQGLAWAHPAADVAVALERLDHLSLDPELAALARRLAQDVRQA